MKVITVFLLCLVCSSAFGEVHGQNTIFNSNSFGGNWTCFMSAASGACAAGTGNQFFNAACDGTTSDETALAAWKSYGAGLGSAPANLYIPPGHDCNINTDAKLTAGIKNATVWGYGAKVHTTGIASQPWIGGDGLFDRVTATNNSLTWSSGIVTVTTSNPHGLTNPSTQIISIFGVSPAGYNGTFVASVTGASTFTYALVSNPGTETVAGQFVVEHSTLINSASAGATVVTVSQVGGGAIFNVNDWVIASGVSLQQSGFPPNWQYFSFHQITNVSGDSITLTPSLPNALKSTWPTPGFFNGGGPAMISRLAANWDTTVNIFGLTIPPTGNNGGNTVGRNINLTGVQWLGGGPTPNQTQNWIANFSEITNITEIDKESDNVTFNNVTSSLLAVTTRAVNKLTINSSSLRGGFGVVNALNGTATNTTINNSYINGLKIAPQGTAWANNITVKNTQFVQSSGNFFPLAKTALSYSNGTFSILYASGSFATAVQWGCVNCQYYFCYTGAPSQRTADDSQIHHFTITDIQGDGTTYFYVTDLVGSLPSPTFGGQAYDEYCTFPVNTVTQSNSGPDNLVQFAFP